MENPDIQDPIIQEHQEDENQQNRDQREHPFQNENIIGPIELNILERVEYGLAVSDPETETKQENSQHEEKKFEGKKEVIFVSGWINIKSIYEQHKINFFAKIVIGILLTFAIKSQSQIFYLIPLFLIKLNFVFALQSAWSLYVYWNTNSSIKITFWVDLQESICYQIYFLGYFLYLTFHINAKCLPLFACPFMLYALTVFLYTSDHYPEVMTKKFAIFEALQLLFISAKISGMTNLSWSYVLVLYLAGAIYLTVLGMFMCMILSCSLIGIFQRRIETWKSKSLLWMTFNYLSSGIVYILILKAIIHYYKGDILNQLPPEISYNNYTNEDALPRLQNAVWTMMVMSCISLIFLLIVRKDVLKFFTKVVYKNEIRKEVSLRFFAKSFTYKLIQASTTYFLKQKQIDSSLTDEVVVNVGSPDEQEKNIKNEVLEKGKTSDRELCVFCYDRLPNIMIDPCGHGGVCKECMLHSLRGSVNKCAFCKGKITKLFVLDFDEADGKYVATGEIKISC